MGKAGRGREIREKWGQVDQFYEEKQGWRRQSQTLRISSYFLSLWRQLRCEPCLGWLSQPQQTDAQRASPAIHSFSWH